MRTSDARSCSTSSSGRPGDPSEQRAAERLAEHRGVLHERTLRIGEAVEARGDQALQRLRHVERADLPDDAVRRPVLDDEAAVEKHADRLDCVQRDPLCTVENRVHDVLRHARDEAGEELLHRRRRERLEIDGREGALAGAPGRPPLRQFRACERDDEDPLVARPLEQVLDEIEQALVRPLQILEHEHDRVRVGHPLEEQPPRGEELLLLALLRSSPPQKLQQPWLDERALFLVEDVLPEGRTKLLRAGLLAFVLGDAAAHPHHVGERPVRDAFAVGEAAAAVPPDRLRDPVEVLVELPADPRLADPGDAGDRDEVRLALVGGRVEEILDQAKLARAADERAPRARSTSAGRVRRRRRGARARAEPAPTCP